MGGGAESAPHPPGSGFPTKPGWTAVHLHITNTAHLQVHDMLTADNENPEKGAEQTAESYNQ